MRRNVFHLPRPGAVGSERHFQERRYKIERIGYGLDVALGNRCIDKTEYISKLDRLRSLYERVMSKANVGNDYVTQ